MQPRVEATTIPPMAEQASAAALAPAAADGAGEPHLGRGRRIAIWVLIVLSSLICLVSILTVWVERQVLDNDSWSNATQKVIADPAVQHSVATRLVDSLYANVNVPAALQQRLPAQLDGIAAPLASALHDRAITATEELMQRPKLQALIVNASATAHQKLINVLENKTGYGITTGNGVVTINLTQLLQQVAADIGLPGKLVAKLPPDAGTITLMKSNQLNAAQTGVNIIRVMSAWLLVAVLALYGFAIFLAHGQRRRTLARVGWSLVIVGFLVLIARRALGSYLVGALATAEQKTPVHHLYLIGTSILGDIGRATVLYGLIAALGAVLAGGSSIAIRIRSHLAPVAAERPAVLWGSVAFVFLLLVLWGGTHALRTWWGILLLGGLLALGCAALHRQLLDELTRQRLQPATNGGTPARRAAEELEVPAG